MLASELPRFLPLKLFSSEKSETDTTTAHLMGQSTFSFSFVTLLKNEGHNFMGDRDPSHFIERSKLC